MIYRMRYCALLLSCFALLGGCEERHSTFRLLDPALTFDKDIAVKLAESFEQNSRHRIEVVPLPAGFETPLDALEAGYADLALSSNAQRYRKGITTVMPLYPTVLHIMYRKDRPADTLEDLLRGASVNAGSVGSASRKMLLEVLEGMALEADEIDFVTGPEVLPDVTVLYMPISPDGVRAILERFGAVGEYRFMSLGSPEEIGTGSAIDRAVLLNPRLQPFVIPVSTYGDIPEEPVLTLAVDKLLVSRPGLDESAVYDLIGEIRRLQPALAATRPLLFQELSREFDATGSAFVLHPGAQAFKERDAPSLYERYSGVAEVLVTLVIGLVSGGYAVVQIYNRRRKSRIDVFYKDVMAVRDSIGDHSAATERAAAVERIRALQNKAFDMLIHEKLAADESFRIFITLSNDIIEQIQ